MNHVARMPGRFNDRSMALMGIPDLPQAAFGGDLPPFQRKALVKAMGIKPQGGGGGGLASVVAVVAAVAIPFAAPVIASSIGLSAGIAAATGISATAAATVGSAIVGAGLGAVSASVTGGNVGRGALMGAIGGGIGGYTSAPASASGSISSPYGLNPNTSGTATGLSLPKSLTPSLAGSPSLGSNLSFVPDYSLSSGMTAAYPGMGGGTGVTFGGSGIGLNPAEAGLTLGGTTQSGLSAGLSSQPTSPYSLSGMSAPAPAASTDPYALTNTSYAGAGSNLPAASQYGNLPPESYALTSTPTSVSGTSGASEFGLKATPTTTASVGGLNTATAGTAGTAGTSTAGGAASTAEKLTFTQALAKVPEALQAKFTDPKALADLTLRAGAQLLTGQLADAGLSDEEKQLLQARVEEMKQNKTLNNELFQTQLREAYDLLGRSDYFDPSYFGEQYASAAKQRTAAQKEAALRKVNPRNRGSRAALERQYNLQSAREEATAYDKGSMYGFDAGLKLTQQALNALPKNAPSSSADATALSTAYNTIEERKRKSQEGLNKTFGPVIA